MEGLCGGPQSTARPLSIDQHVGDEDEDEEMCRFCHDNMMYVYFVRTHRVVFSRMDIHSCLVLDLRETLLCTALIFIMF